MAELSVLNLTHFYKNNRALNDVSATLGNGVTAL